MTVYKVSDHLQRNYSRSIQFWSGVGKHVVKMFSQCNGFNGLLKLELNLAIIYKIQIQTVLSHRDIFGETFGNKSKQAGAELGQAQLKLGLNFHSINLN